VDGGTGYDVINFSGKSTDYTYNVSAHDPAGNYTVTSNVDGSSVTLTNVEMLVFADKEEAILLPTAGVSWTDLSGVDNRISFPDSPFDFPTHSSLLASDPTYGRDLINNDTLHGSSGDDILNAGPGNDSITGDGGNDPLYGRYGNDTVAGGTGNDSVHGDSGNDCLFGNSGTDSLDGGLGDDTLHGDNDTAGGASTAPGSDTLVDYLGHNQLFGDEGNDLLQGTGTLHGNVGNDTIDGDLANSGGELYGDDGNDALSSGNNNPTALLVGGSGNDTLYGNGTLYGDSTDPNSSLGDPTEPLSHGGNDLINTTNDSAYGGG